MAVELPLSGQRQQKRQVHNLKEQHRMKNFLLKCYVKAQIFREDNGQDLIEYALVVALIAFAATVGMNTVASNINQAFVKIGSKVTTYVS
jgi:pilus assembly protein Flp/PilA